MDRLTGPNQYSPSTSSRRLKYEGRVSEFFSFFRTETKSKKIFFWGGGGGMGGGCVCWGGVVDRWMDRRTGLNQFAPTPLKLGA